MTKPYVLLHSLAKNSEVMNILTPVCNSVAVFLDHTLERLRDGILQIFNDRSLGPSEVMFESYMVNKVYGIVVSHDFISTQ